MVSSLRTGLALCVFLNFIVIRHGAAQGKLVADSLNRIVQTSGDDTERIKAYIELASLSMLKDKDAALRYCDSAWQVGSSKEYTGMQCLIRCAYASIFRTHHDTVNYIKSIKDAQSFARRADGKKYMGFVYHQQALYEYYNKKDPEKTLEFFLKSIDLTDLSYNTIRAEQYYILASIFDKLGDYDAGLSYARKAKRYAVAITDICMANYSIANACFHLADYRTETHAHLADTSLFLLHQTRVLLKNKTDMIREPRLPLLVFTNLADVYMQIEQKQDADSAKHYLNLARDEANAINDEPAFASLSVKLAEYFIEADRLAEAEILLIYAKETYKDSSPSDLQTEAEISLGFAKLREKKGTLKEALADYWNYYEMRDSVYKIESLKATKNIETRFNLEKKEQQIGLLKEREKDREKTTWLSIILACISVLSALMLYRSTWFRRRFYKEKERVLLQQAENMQLQKAEAEYALQLQVKESERLAIERKIEKDQKEQYQRELIASVSYVEKKNELLLSLRNIIAETSAEKDVKADNVGRMLKLLEENLVVDNDFERFTKNFELVYPDFFTRLHQRAVDRLSQLDLRYCAYIYMGLSTKEMSNLLNIDPASIRTARYRLKQKFNLGKDEELVELINNNQPVE